MRLHRPYIPWSVRELVVLLQLRAAGINVDEKPYVTIRYHGSAETRVRAYLRVLFGDEPVELHHRPALVNRKIISRSCLVATIAGQLIRGWWRDPSDPSRVCRYEPDANDPDYLVYLRAGAGGDHDVETRVRGQRGQYSDLALARKRKRKARKATRPRRRLRSRGFERRRPQRSATRPITR